MDKQETRVAAGQRLRYRAPEISDLGSVVDVTEASSVPAQSTDNAGYGPPGHS
jgi:hypothetical protein